MALIIVGVVLFNIGFLVGAWWGSGWGRDQQNQQEAVLSKPRREFRQKAG